MDYILFINGITLTPTGNGTLTLTATISFPCSYNVSLQTINLTKQISVGTPTTTCQQIGNGICYQTNFLCPSQLEGWKYVVLFGTWGAGGTGYHLQTNGGGYFNNGLTTQDITTNSFSVYVPSGGNNVTVWAMNGCGVSQNPPYVIIYTPKSYGCYGGYNYKVSPNPATKSLTVTSNAKNISGKNTQAGFTQIQITDKFGTIKKQYKYPRATDNVTLNISDLPTDVYILRIFDGTNWEEQKIIIQK